MNFLECLKKVKDLPDGTKFGRKEWTKFTWVLDKPRNSIKHIHHPEAKASTDYICDLLAEDWEIVEEKPELTKQEKKPIEYHARIICLRDFDKNQMDFMKEAINPKYHEITFQLALALNKATEDFWRNVEIPT